MPQSLIVIFLFLFFFFFNDTATTEIYTLSLHDALPICLPTGVCLAHGPEARLLLANHATAQLWGAEWQLGQPLQEFLTTHQIRVARRDGQPLAFEQLAVMRALRRCETVQSHQEVIRPPDGTTLPVLAHAV